MWKRKVKRLLKSGMTQEELGDLVGVSQAYISLIAAGLKKNLSYDLGAKIDAEIELLDKAMQKK